MSETRLKYVASVAYSGVDKKTAEDEIPIHLCNYVDVYSNPSITADLAFMSATASADETRRFALSPDDILITKDSETAEDIGVPAQVAENLPGVICGYHLALVRPDPSRVFPRYLYWCLASEATRQYLAARANGVTRFGLRQDALELVPLRLPERDRQEEVASYLDRKTRPIDELLTVKRRLRELLVTKRAEIVEAGVGGYIDGQARTSSPIPWLPTVPEGWEVTRLQYSARLGSGHTPSRQHPEWWVDCAIPWITTGEVHRFRDDRLEVLEETEQHISELGLANSSAELHPAGTVVLSRTASVGFSAIMGRPMATSQDFATWTCSAQLVPEFLLYCLRAMRRDLLGRLAQGSTHQTIYMPDIERIMVPVPPVAKQRAIVNEIRRRVAPLDALADALDAQLPKLIEYRRALVTSALAEEPSLTAA